MCTTESPFFFFVIKNVNISRFLLISGSLSSCTQACADKGKEGWTQWDLFRWVQLLCEEEVTGVMALGWKLCVSALPTSCSRYHCAPLASEKETLSWLSSSLPPYHTKTLGWAQLSMGAISQILSFCSKLTLLEKGCCQS